MPNEARAHDQSEETGARQAQVRFGRIMREPPFDSTPEFQRFKEVMRGVLAVPKATLDALVEQAKRDSPRVNNPRAPGKKRLIKRKRKSKPSQDNPHC